LAEDELGGDAAADVAVADEKYLFHVVHALKMQRYAKIEN
jgi:hypothetical protein